MNYSERFFSLFSGQLIRRKIIVYLITFCLIGLSFYFFLTSVGRAYMGFDLSFQDGEWKVSVIDTNALASQKGVKVGDKPLGVNNQPADEFLKKYEKAGTAYSMLFKEITVIDEQGKVTTVFIDNNFLYTPILASQVSTFIVCLVFWITGLFVFYKRPKNPAALLLCLACAMFGVLFCSNMAAELGSAPAMVVTVFASLIGPWMLVHFFLVLPEERTWAQRSPLIYLFYLPAVMTFILFWFIGYADGQPLPGFRVFRFSEVGIGLLLVAIILVLNYVRAASIRTKQQMIVVLTGCLAALIPFVALFLVPQMLKTPVVLPPGYSILFLIFIPIGMAVAVVTQRLMDIDLVVRRGVIYGLITVVMAAVLSAALFPVLLLRQSLGVFQQVIIALLLGAVATALFGPSKKGIEALIDRLFYKDRYDYRSSIHSFSMSLSDMKEANEIARLLVGTTVRTLNLASSCLMIKSETGNFEVSAVQGTFMGPDEMNKLEIMLSERNKLLEFPNSASSANPEVAYLIPLMGGGREIGVLFLSHKVSRQEFSSDDILLLQGLVSVASAALHSSILVRDVSLRNTFVSIASHELRTPLTSILGYAELILMRDPPEESRRKWLVKIITNGQKISAMVDDLLNVSRIQSGKVSMKMEPVKLEEFLRERLAIALETDDKHSFELEVGPELPEALVDRDKFGQVIGNLLSNAVKFSPNGGPIRLTAHYEPPQRRIVVSVEDHGMGIGESDRESLFTTFHRIQRPETQGIRGSGLGLYIVKEWTQAMGGEIWLKSELNKGSTFFIAVQAVSTNL